MDIMLYVLAAVGLVGITAYLFLTFTILWVVRKTLVLPYEKDDS